MQKPTGRNYNSENTTHYYSLTKGLLSLKNEKKNQKEPQTTQKNPTAKQYLADFTDSCCWLHCSSVKQTYLTFRQHADHQPFFPSPPSLINPKTERRIKPPWELFPIHLFCLQGNSTSNSLHCVCCCWLLTSPSLVRGGFLRAGSPQNRSSTHRRPRHSCAALRSPARSLALPPQG